MENEYREIFSQTVSDFIPIETKRLDFDKVKKYEDLEIYKKESKNKKF